MNYVCILEIRIDIAIEMAKDNGPCTVEFLLCLNILLRIFEVIVQNILNQLRATVFIFSIENLDRLLDRLDDEKTKCTLNQINV